MKMKMKKFGKVSSIFQFSISKLDYTEFFMKILEKFFWLIFKLFLIYPGKNEDEHEKVWENEFNFLIIHIKIRLHGNFHENLLKKNLTHFLGHFWLIEAKMKMKMKTFGKMSLIFLNSPYQN